MTVLFLDSVHQYLENKLNENGFSCIDGTTISKEDCIKQLHNVDGLVLRSRFTMNEDFLKHAPNLKFIARSGAGMENIDEVYCALKNITLFNAPEGNRNAVGEHALGMLLSLMNKFQQGDRDVRQGIWDREGNRGEEIMGKTIGIIGYGNNGSSFAEKLKGFDCTILVYDKYKKIKSNSYISQTSLETLYREADVISFHIPQNKETIYWANTAFFTSLSKPIFLLNLARGKIVNTKALLIALKKGIVKGAGLDVLEFEKSSFEHFEENGNNTFLTLMKQQNVLLTPHVGGWTNESYLKLSMVLADKIIAWYQNVRIKKVN